MINNPLETLSAQNSTEQKAAERNKKGANGFKESYDTALQLRDLARGWGKYENIKNLPFGTLISQIGMRSQNLAKNALKSDKKISPEFIEKIIEDIETAGETIIRFEEKKLKLIAPLRDYLDELKQRLKNGEAIQIFESATKLSSYYTGFMYANEVLLAPADEAAGSHNSATKKTGQQ